MVKTKKKQLYIKSSLEENKNNSRATWKVINQLIGKKKQNPTSSMMLNDTLIISNKIAIANHSNNYFTSVAEKLVKKISTTDTTFSTFLKIQSVIQFSYHRHHLKK